MKPLQRLVDSTVFTTLVIAVILANAVVLGLQTYAGIEREYGDTLDFPIYMERGMEIHPWWWIYFVSFVMIAAFIVINVLIGIVLNSMEEARELERRRPIARARSRPSPSGFKFSGSRSTSSSASCTFATSRSVARTDPNKNAVLSNSDWPCDDRRTGRRDGASHSRGRIDLAAARDRGHAGGARQPGSLRPDTRHAAPADRPDHARLGRTASRATIDRQSAPIPPIRPMTGASTTRRC